MAKYAHDTVVPFKESNMDKKSQVATMFDRIAFRYDFLNRFLSAGIDVQWRKKAVRELTEMNPAYVLDVATGTADVAIMTHQRLKTNRIIGLDISEGMLDLGRKKIAKLGLTDHITLLKGDSENIPFANNEFDAVTVAFGVRNFENLEKGMQEIFRVLKPGGKLVVLEFSRPKNPLVKWAYNIYMEKLAPGIGGAFSKNKDAYTYLNESAQRFPEREGFGKVLENTGFIKTKVSPMTLGICCLYAGIKPAQP